MDIVDVMASRWEDQSPKPRDPAPAIADPSFRRDGQELHRLLELFPKEVGCLVSILAPPVIDAFGLLIGLRHRDDDGHPLARSLAMSSSAGRPPPDLALAQA